MDEERSIVNILSRCEIETILAFVHTNFNVKESCKILGTTRSAFYHDISDIKKKTGVDPEDQDWCVTLAGAIESVRAEEMKGGDWSFERHFGI